MRVLVLRFSILVQRDLATSAIEKIKHLIL